MKRALSHGGVCLLSEITTKNKNTTQISCASWFEFIFTPLLENDAGALKKRRRQQSKHTIEIWLILPVVICLFQGLSHACLRITALQESAHGSLHQTQSAAKMLRFPQNWIPWRNAKLIHEYTRAFSIHVASFRRRRSESPRE